MDENLDISRLIKARHTFEKFRVNLGSEQEKAGAVQAFEFCYELAWKMMKRFLKLRGLESGSPKDTFRKAAIEGLIEDPELWFEFQKKRNLTVHTYNVECLDLLIEIFDSFSQELNKLMQNLKED